MKTNLTIAALVCFAGPIFGQSSQQTFEFDPANRLISIEAGATAHYTYDQVGNRLGTTTTSNSEDIDLSWINPAASLTSVAPAASLTLTGDETNTGLTDAPAHQVQAFLSTNDVYESATDVPLPPALTVGIVPSSNSSTAHSWTVSIPPNTAPGPYYLLLVADSQEEIDETNETNNVAAIPINVVDCSVFTASTIATDASCDQFNGAANAVTTNGTAPYSYAWSTAQSSAVISGLGSGTYSLTATDANGCEAIAEAIITMLPSPVVVASATEALCASNGSASATATLGTAPYSFLWSNAATTSSISGLGAGTYTVTLTDANGCTNTDEAEVTSDNGLYAEVITMHPQCLNGGSDGSVSAFVSGGVTDYTYQWNGMQTVESLNGLGAGTYTVTVTDAAGCEAVASGELVLQPGGIPINMAPTDATCGLNNGAMSAFPAAGSFPFTFAWSTGSTAPSLNGLSPNTYDLTLTDTNGCIGTGSASVAATALPTVVATQTDVTAINANDGTATASVSGTTSPYNFSWSNGGSSAVIANLAAGEYTVTVTDAIGCAVVASATVAEPACPQMAGTYHIGGSNADFTSIQEAVDAMVCGTIVGPVTLEVAAGSGPYNEQVTIPEIPGADATNTVTFEGNGETISYAPTKYARHLLKLDGADYVTFNNFELSLASNAQYGWAVHLKNGADHNTISNCNITKNNSAIASDRWVGIVSSSNDTIYTPYGINGNNLSIINNSISGNFYHGLYLENTSTNGGNNLATDYIIRGNTILNPVYTGMFLQFHAGTIIEDNTIVFPGTGNIATRGMWLLHLENSFMVRNNTVTQARANGIALWYANLWQSGTGTVVNNQIDGSSWGSSPAGIWNFHSINVGYYHNSVDMSIGTNSGSCLRTYGDGTGLDIRNNSFAMDAQSANAYVLDLLSPTDLLACDYNNYLHTGSKLMLLDSTEYSSLTALQAAPGPVGHNQHSLVGDPGYLSASNLQHNGSQLSHRGIAIANIATDINGLLRDPNAPDIGAYELPCSETIELTAQADTFLCDGDTIPLMLLGHLGTYAYQWQNNASDITGANSSNHEAAQTGSYRCIVTDINGCMDTTNALPVTNVANTQILAQECGDTLPTLNFYFHINSVPGAQRYAYEITNTLTGAIDTAYSPASDTDATYFSLGFVPVAEYNTPYQIRVRAKVNDFWGCFGAACVLHTPVVLPTTRLTAAYCDDTLQNLNDYFYWGTVPGAELYQLKISNNTGYNHTTYGIAPNPSTNPPPAYYTFNLLNGITFQTQYTISIRARINGVWADWGQPCTITTPEVVHPQLRADFCDKELQLTDKYIYCTPIPNAERYYYEYRKETTGTLVGHSASPSYAPTVNWTLATSVTPGPLLQGETYTVTVKVKLNGLWGPYGDTCRITMPGTSAKLAPYVAEASQPTAQPYSLVIFPNPNHGNFRLLLNTSKALNEEPITIEVTNALGQTVYQQPHNAGALLYGLPLQLGTRAPGIYFVRAYGAGINELGRFVIR